MLETLEDINPLYPRKPVSVGAGQEVGREERPWTPLYEGKSASANRSGSINCLGRPQG
jgi:hypothetical protein